VRVSTFPSTSQTLDARPFRTEACAAGALDGRRHARASVDEDEIPIAKAPTARPKSAGKPKKTYREKTHRLIKGSEKRKIRTGRRDGFVADVPVSRLGGKLVSADSMLEADFVLVTDAYEDDFTDIISQPFTLAISVNGRERKWTPDYLIVRKARFDEIVEVKILSWLYHTDSAKRLFARERLRAMRAAAEERGCKFRLVTEDEIRVQPRLWNAMLVYRHCGPFLQQADLVSALTSLARAPDESAVGTFGEILPEALRSQALRLAIVLERLGHLVIDRSERYSAFSRFTKTARDPSGASE
jgi:hypothetical protein